jgi:hypothetical protein
MSGHSITSSAIESSPGDREAECLCGPEVDDEVEFRGLLNRNICRLFALQDFVHQLRRAPVLLPTIGGIRH